MWCKKTGVARLLFAFCDVTKYCLDNIVGHFWSASAQRRRQRKWKKRTRLSTFFKTVHPSSTETSGAVSRQVATAKFPRGTRYGPLNAATFPSWHGSQCNVARDLVINTPYLFQTSQGTASDGIQSCCSGLQVQGTASSPLSTVMKLYISFCFLATYYFVAKANLLPKRVFCGIFFVY